MNASDGKCKELQTMSPKRIKHEMTYTPTVTENIAAVTDIAAVRPLSSVLVSPRKG